MDVNIICIMCAVLVFTSVPASCKELYITTIVSEPFVFGSDNNFKGMLVDLMDELWSEMAETKKTVSGYKFHMVKDNLYGAPVNPENKNGEWTGMIGELRNNHVADVAIAPLTVTEDRLNVVDFSTPWLPIYLTVLIKKQFELWTLEQLVKQDEVKFGCVTAGSTKNTFEKSTSYPYNEMWKKMNNADNIANNTQEAVRRVIESSYAFITESPTAEYEVSKRHDHGCDLVTFGRFKHSQGYAFAFPRNSKYRDDFEEALNRKLQQGTVDRLYQKWIVGNGKCGRLQCNSSASGLLAQMTSLSLSLLFVLIISL